MFLLGDTLSLHAEVQQGRADSGKPGEGPPEHEISHAEPHHLISK